MVPGRLSDNHAAIDLALTVFDFGAPGFWELVHSVRCATFDAAAEHGAGLVVTTFCYAAPDDRPLYEDFEAIMQRRGGELLPVFLHCSREEAARRVGNPDRVERGKLTSAESLMQGFRPLRFRAGAAGRLPEARHRGAVGGSDGAGNHPPFRAWRLRHHRAPRNHHSGTTSHRHSDDAFSSAPRGKRRRPNSIRGPSGIPRRNHGLCKRPRHSAKHRRRRNGTAAKASSSNAASSLRPTWPTWLGFT